MKKVVMTQDMIEAYFSRMKDRKFDPNKPFCRICSCVPGDKSNARFMHPESIRINYFHVGETVYEVTYPNGQKGFYHIGCMDDPKREDQKIMVEDILRYDVDKWKGVEDFIGSLVEKKVSDKQIITEVGLKFNCSYTTAWRRLRDFKSRMG